MKSLIISVLSIILFFSVALFTQAQGASLFLSPGSESFIIGDIFSVKVNIDTNSIPINAAQITIDFPPDKLEVLDISKSGSIFSLWTEEPVFSNSSGKISFSGGMPHPGFTGIGNIITINFKAKNEGVVNVTFGEGAVLADDGKGTDILVFMKEAKYSIQGAAVFPEIKPEASLTEVPSSPQILSPTHPQEGEWYSNNSPRFQWELTSDITGVSFTFDRNPDTIPDTEPKGRFQSKIYEDIDDGIWYFHLRIENEMGWSSPSHRKVQIDVHFPHPFEIIIDNTGDSTNPNPNLYFEARDDTSGVNYYKLKIGEGDFFNLLLAQVNPFSLPFQYPGRQEVIVRAVDWAGNNVETETTINVEPIASPQITLWPKTYIAGEETFYTEGTALPEVEITIFLKKNGEEIKRWETLSNNQGEWSFSTKELLKSGFYYVSTKAEDKRGAVSDISDSRKVEVRLSGIHFGPFIVVIRKLV